MKFYIKQKVFSWRDRFYIYDEWEREAFSVEGEIFTWGKKLHVYDANGNRAAFIRERFAWLRPRYTIEIEGREVCDLVKEFKLFRQSYRLEGLPLRLEGDFLAHEYELFNEQSEQCVSRLSKKWLSWGDSYELEVFEPGAELLSLCVCLAVDCVLEQQAAVAASV